MNMVRLVPILTRAVCTTGKSVIMDRVLCILKILLKMRKMGVYGIELIKIDAIVLRGFMETVLTSTLVQ